MTRLTALEALAEIRARPDGTDRYRVRYWHVHALRSVVPKHMRSQLDAITIGSDAFVFTEASFTWFEDAVKENVIKQVADQLTK